MTLQLRFRSVVTAAFLAGLAACASGPEVCQHDPVTGAEQFRVPVSEIGVELYPIGLDLWADDAFGDNVDAARRSRT